MKTMSPTHNNKLAQDSSLKEICPWGGVFFDLVFWWEAELQRGMKLEFPFSV